MVLMKDYNNQKIMCPKILKTFFFIFYKIYIIFILLAHLLLHDNNIWICVGVESKMDQNN